MTKIIDNKTEAKKYIDGVNTLFRLYRMKAEICADEAEKKELLKIINSTKSGTLYSGEPSKKTVLEKHLIEGVSLSKLARELGYSNSYIYHLNQCVIRDLAMIIFKVLIV